MGDMPIDHVGSKGGEEDGDMKLTMKMPFDKIEREMKIPPVSKAEKILSDIFYSEDQPPRKGYSMEDCDISKNRIRDMFERKGKH